MVVAQRLYRQSAAGEEDELGAVVALADQPLARSELGEAQLGVSGHLHQVGVAHALKEAELQQTVVDIHSGLG